MLAADRDRLQLRLAAVLRPWTLGVHRLRLVLGLGLVVGNHISLRTLVSPPALGLVLVAGHGLGAVLGDMALLE